MFMVLGVRYLRSMPFRLLRCSEERPSCFDGEV